MKARDYLPDGEKGFRIRIYVGGQANKAEKIEGAMDVFDFLNTETEEGILLVTEKTYMQLEDCDFACKSCFIDGTYGYYDPAGKEFYELENYGRTWTAIKIDTNAYTESLPLAWAMIEKLNTKRE